MPISFPGRRLLALPLMAPLFACADRPAGPPMVLRPPPPQRHAHRAAPRPSAAAQSAPAAESRPDDLSPANKESLFRDFDAYLGRSGRN